MHPSVHLELARIKQQELIAKAQRSRATLVRLEQAKAGPSLKYPTLRRRSSTVPSDARQ